MQLLKSVAAWAVLSFVALPSVQVFAQTPIAAPAPAKWYDKMSLRGYAQFRYNRLLESNENYKCEQCDKSIGKGQNFSFRRARLVFSGNPHERVFVYFQFDYSSDASSTAKHFLQLRDAYFDYTFDKKKEFRLRLGQSKVPFGFENMQSSQNRLPFDRADPTNSAVPNERDFGGYLLYAPKHVRETFKLLADEGLKHSNDYGAVTFGIYNGQGTNRLEQNDNLHAVGRVSWPLKIGRQIIEPGISAYSGKYTLAADQTPNAAVKLLKDRTYTDRRIGATAVLYAQPIGILAEYNRGESPTFNPATDSIEVKKLDGGFVTVSYRHKFKTGEIQPFVRLQVFDGGKKLETEARHHAVRETEMGVEWQVNKAVELTVSYVVGHRKYQDFKVRGYDEKGRFLRVQAQFNY